MFVRNIFLPLHSHPVDGYGAAEEDVQKLPYQPIKYVLMNFLVANTLGSISALIVDKRSRSDAFIDSIAQHKADNSAFVKPVTAPMFDRTTAIPKSDTPTDFDKRRR